MGYGGIIYAICFSSTLSDKQVVDGEKEPDQGEGIHKLNDSRVCSRRMAAVELN